MAEQHRVLVGYAGQVKLDPRGFFGEYDIKLFEILLQGGGVALQVLAIEQAHQQRHGAAIG